jgi:hypothetical protein
MDDLLGDALKLSQEAKKALKILEDNEDLLKYPQNEEFDNLREDIAEQVGRLLKNVGERQSK